MTSKNNPTLKKKGKLKELTDVCYYQIMATFVNIATYNSRNRMIKILFRNHDKMVWFGSLQNSSWLNIII